MYLHIPFCASKCDYCAFATWTDRDHLVERVGGRLRAQMPFLDPVEVVAGQSQASATTPGAAR